MTVAQNILNQLGGAHALAVMTGAKVFTESKNSLTFKFGRSPGTKANALSVELDADDTYRATFYKLGGKDVCVQVGETVTGLHAEELRGLFAETTGFDLQVPRVVAA